MKASLSWLSDYVAIDMDIDHLVDALTMVGLEVESVSNRYDYLANVLVGKITAINDHPNAEKLRVCELDIGDRRIRAVCGAPNTEKGMLVPVALPGTVFPDGNILGQSVIRGTKSEGMICSEMELGLGLDAGGIMALDSKLPIGSKLYDALDLSDKVIEIDLTPNRPDCLSIIGIAREIAGIQKTGLTYPDYDISDSDDDIAQLTSVQIEAPDLCPRYAARLVTDISVEPSPYWLQNRLMSVGLRPINNIVDITNFVMLETGQPLHAFDFDQLAENRIVVRTAAQGESFTTLDQKQRQLNDEMLMICDGQKSVAIGGVMGGLNSEIENFTTRVLIESAYFNPISIRKTSKKLGLSSDAAHRFERGVDPQGTIKALNRAARLMLEFAGGNLVSGLIDAHPKPVPDRTIRLSTHNTNRLLGTEFTADEMTSLLKSIEFDVNKNDSQNLAVAPPSFRVDVMRPEDLMEEVARLSGYNNIPLTYPQMPAQAKPILKILNLRNRIKRLMAGLGFSEAITYSFIARDSCDRLVLKENDACRKTIAILNPLTEEQAVMRTSLIPGLLETMHRNLAQQEKDLKLFEIGKVYFAQGADRLPDEEEMLAGLWSGSRYDASWHGKEIACDFFDLKGVVESLLQTLGVADVEFSGLADTACSYTRSGYSAQIQAGNQPVGRLGEVHPRVLNNFDLKQTTYIFELNINRLLTVIPDLKKSQPIPKFPAVSRDATLIVDHSVESRSILRHVEQLDEALIEDLHLFDVFAGEPIPAGKKSISFRIVYRSSTRTLEDEEINRLHKAITGKLIRNFNASLPV
jgi:phenylalanyl-tRNA synthetase beta chain